jgi:hypothetical protein
MRMEPMQENHQNDELWNPKTKEGMSVGDPSTKVLDGVYLVGSTPGPRSLRILGLRPVCQVDLSIHNRRGSVQESHLFMYDRYQSSTRLDSTYTHHIGLYSLS